MALYLVLVKSIVTLPLREMIATQRSTRPPFAGHPAYDEETRDYIATPRPKPRVKAEAQEYANR